MLNPVTRIIPADGKTKGLTSVSNDLQISREFTDRGLLSLVDITMNLNREEYQYWKLKDEFYSEAFGCRMKTWDIDGKITCISEKLDWYSIDDVKQIAMVCDVFDGEVVKEKKR